MDKESFKSQMKQRATQASSRIIKEGRDAYERDDYFVKKI